ncbi:MAG: STAS domain-containing protein [Sulfuricellaceae bacterium]|jgi:anti-anti-sigma factor
MGFLAIAGVDHGAAKINLKGVLDNHSGEQFRQCSEGLLESPDVREIEVDMGGVSRIDSDALDTLLEIREKAAALNRHLVLTGCRRSVRHTLEEAVFQRMFASR